MPRVEVEDSFLAGLFADLDETFESSVLPSSPAPRSSFRPVQVHRSISRPSKSLSRPPSHAPSPSRLPSRPPPHLPTSISNSTSTFTSRSHTPFWDNPLAHPALSQASLNTRHREERQAGITASPGANGGGGKKQPRRAVVDVLSPKPNRGVKRERELEGGKGKRAVQHVAVEVEERKEEGRGGKENDGAKGVREMLSPRREAGRKVPLFRVKKQEEEEKKPVVKREVKVEEEDAFGDMGMEGIDWDDVMVGFEEEAGVGMQDKGPPRSKQYTRCEVQEVVDNVGPTNRRQKIITVSGSTIEGLQQVVLCDDWVDSQIEIGDIVNLIGAFSPSSDASLRALTLTRSDGLLILHPDILVSSTKVADSSTCTRKAVLQELIRTVGGLTPSLVYGNMLHALMQSCLTEGRWEEEYRNEKIDEIVKQTGGQLWTMDVGFDKAREEMRERSKEFGDFAERFIGSKPRPDAVLSDPRALESALARLAVTSTLAVEEDIWSPRFGLKGKIDVSVTSSVLDSVGFTRKGTTPFEIKTGRATAGMEHRAQTMLYTLLMSDRYDEDVDSGLLYYSQGNQVFRVQAARNEIRGLIIARNNFASYLHRRMTLTSSGFVPYSQATAPPTSSPACKKEKAGNGDNDDDDDAMWAELDGGGAGASNQAEEEVALLPPPIDDEWGCKKCYARDSCMLFRRTVEGELEISTDESDPLQVLYEDKTGHLTEAHAEFFRHWEKLISYEEQEMVRFKREIWTMQADEREKVGRCLANMVIKDVKTLDPNEAPSIHRFTYRLSRSTSNNDGGATSSLLGGMISTNDAVVVSLEAPSVLAVSRGFVLSITAHEILLGLDQSLTDFPQAKRATPSSSSSTPLVYRIDKDELAAGMGRIRDNLIQLFVAGGDERRRRLVVDLEAPSFNAAVAAQKDRLIPSTLNDDQKVALGKVLAAEDYCLILGMPGTGKTTTIAEVLKALAAAGKSVLLTSYTHSAVDNILLKVKDSGLSILRLGNKDKIMPALHQYTLTPEDYSVSLADIDQKLMLPQIVATTCLSINEPIFTKRRFDVCIVDEASQVTLPTCLGPLRFADKFVLVGDHNQLPPLVRNLSARKAGLDISLFKRLSDAHPAAVVNLTQQYRMNEDIMHLSNSLVYDGQLKVGSEDVGKRRLRLVRGEKKEEETMQPWLKEVVDPDRSVLFVDTDALPARELKRGSLIENELEAALVKQTVSTLTALGVDEAEIGVISPYRQQIKLLSRELQHFPGVEVLTADRSQGRDKEVIIISLVRSNASGNVGDLLKDWRRLNVCLTRARSKLVLFGSRSTLRHVPLLAQFLHLVEGKDWVYELPTGVGEGLRRDSVVVKKEVEEDVKPVLRAGGGALVARQPLVRDVLNSL